MVQRIPYSRLPIADQHLSPVALQQVDISREGEQSQEVLAILLIVLTVALLLTAVAECLLEARRLSRDDGSDSDQGHVFLRREAKPKESGFEEKEKYRTSRGLLHAPKLLDVPENRVSMLSIFSRASRAVCFVCGNKTFR